MPPTPAGSGSLVQRWAASLEPLQHVDGATLCLLCVPPLLAVLVILAGDAQIRALARMHGARERGSVTMAHCVEMC